MRIKSHWKRWLVAAAALAMVATVMGGCGTDTEKYPPEDVSVAVFGYYWAPTALMGQYDWYILEEPAYDAEVWAEIMAAKDDPTDYEGGLERAP